MSNKFLMGIAAAFLAVFVVGIGAVVGITRVSDRTTISYVNPSSGPASSETTAAAFTPNGKTPDGTTSAAAQASAVAILTAPTGQVVSDTDINQLASAVKLGNSSTGDVGKEVWVRETPVAERLLNGMCDCDQRNWLVHFVKTGHEAMEGSENYPQSVQLLATLRRSNKDLMQPQAHL